MSTTITPEQLRQFFERAEKAERLAEALEKQVQTIKGSGGIKRIQFLFLYFFFNVFGVYDIG